MFEKFLYYNFSLFEGKKIILSCSGGMDSMVLLHLLQQIDCTLIVYHVDHLSRNGQSTQDKHFVNQYCSQHNIDIHCNQFQHESGNFQSDSRAFRYEGLDHLLKETQSDFITTAHHMGDNNETFLINAMRGSGLKGLTGMKAVDPPLVRPLLYFNRKEIENYALEYQVPYVKDVSNELNLYVRNIIRNEFLSRVEKLNPNIDKRINHTIEKIRSDYNLLEELIDKIKDKYISANQGMIIVDMDILEHYREGKTLLYHLLSQYGVNIHQIDDMAASGVGTSFDTLDYAINLDRGKLLLKQKVDDYHIELDIPNEGTFMIHQDLHLSVKICDSTQIHKEDNEIILSLAKVTFPLKLRTWMPGDRFYPSGMNGNSKKVSKYLKDLKIPNIEKSGIFVLISDDGNICGIPGYRSDHRYLPDNEEQKVLVIQWIKE